VRRGVGNHHARELVGVRRSLCPQVVEADVALRIAGHHDHRHARHGSASRIGAVRRGGDERNAALRFALRVVVAADAHQACVLARRAGVGLQRHAVKAGNRSEVFAQVGNQLRVALRLLARHQRMHVGKFAPAEGQHFRRRVELHRARAKRNHAVGKRNVATLKQLDVAHQLGFGAVLRKYFFGENGGRAVAAAASSC